MIEAYQFSSTASEVKPDNEITRLLEKADGPLTRAEKDRIAEILYGTFGSHSSAYKLAGWLWPMSQTLPLILVMQYGSWHEYRAPDKTSLRRVLHGNVERMVVA